MSSEEPLADVQAPPTKKARKSSPLLLIVLVAILVVGVGLMILDYGARHSATSAYDSLNEASEEEQVTEAGEPGPQKEITPAEVKEIVGSDPVETSSPSKSVKQEKYSWRGLRTYHVFVIYEKGLGDDDFVMSDISTNDPPESWQEASP